MPKKLATEGSNLPVSTDSNSPQTQGQRRSRDSSRRTFGDATNVSAHGQSALIGLLLQSQSSSRWLVVRSASSTDSLFTAA